MRTIVVIIIKAYQLFISPLFPPSCRFYPTCSEYAIRAIEAHGILKGFVLSARRILKCHPFNPGGWDPVPPKISNFERKT
ncbi:MAG TPA: membrane protein insertion efficiency factor YidD [Thermodesulfobacteriota bacterium]|nr:membrane protein insertion efficiency factor YidD [Deltaproteobacteria bacterium]HNR13418.1 membrane protein insertion efficiency factor YidD [Thermodesulfobacteriota bacterium]